MGLSELAQEIKAAAYLEGEFILRSGKKSHYYLDKYLFETRSGILDKLADAFADKIRATYPDIDLLAAPELGAVAITAVVATRVKKDFVIIRKEKKEYGTAKQIEGSIKGAKNVLIIEDILTTGGAAIQSADCLKAQGLNVVAICGTIDRLQGAQAGIEAAGYRYDSLLTIRDLGVGS